MHCSKSNPNFRDIMRNEEENENRIQHEIFCVVSRFPRCISCYNPENLPISFGTVRYSGIGVPYTRKQGAKHTGTAHVLYLYIF